MVAPSIVAIVKRPPQKNAVPEDKIHCYYRFMKKRSGTFSIACKVSGGLMALVVALNYSFAHAQSAQRPTRTASADLVLCDRLAADPADPDKPADVTGAATIAPTDVAIAIKYCALAAAASPRALYELGRAYAANQQMPEAVNAYRKAADKGNTSAMVELGVLLATGSGVDKDQAQAQELLQRAAAAGNPRGVINLLALSNSGGAPINPVQARAWLTNAAAANSAEAQFQLGLMNANGVGGPKDDVAARAWFEKAAAQNHAEALEWLGSFAESGRGGPRDKAAAKTYYEKSAALGDENAKAALKRLDCPLMIRDKRGNFVSNICF
jgi:uncharacterized protein